MFNMKRATPDDDSRPRGCPAYAVRAVSLGSREKLLLCNFGKPNARSAHSDSNLHTINKMVRAQPASVAPLPQASAMPPVLPNASKVDLPCLCVQQ